MNKARTLALIMLLALSVPSCSPEARLAYLVPDGTTAPGHRALGAESVFENKTVLASARQARDNEISSPLLSSLIEKDFVVIYMTIENRSTSKAIYKPNYTALMNSVDYLKPLDYTDLYEHGGEAADELKGAFFDLDAVILPGEKVSGLLIFPPLSKEAKNAVLEVREYYVGTATTSFSLPFQLKAAPY